MGDMDVLVTDEELTSSDRTVVSRAIERLFEAKLPHKRLAYAMLATFDRPTSQTWRAAAYPSAVPMAQVFNKETASRLVGQWLAELPGDWHAHFWRSILLQCRFDRDDAAILASARRSFDLAVVEGEQAGVDPADRLQVACYLATLAADFGRDEWVEEAADAICALDISVCERAWVDVRETARRVATRPVGPHLQEALREWCERAHAARRAFWQRSGGAIPEEFR